MLANTAKSNRTLYMAAQIARAQIINDHPEIPLNVLFANIDEVIHFAKLYSKTRLNLKSMKFSEEQIEKLANELPNISFLDLSWTKLTDKNMDILAAKLKNLTHLNVSMFTKLGSPGFKAIADNCTNLTSLDLSLSNAKGKDIQYLASRLTNLKYLNVLNCSFNPYHYSSLTNLTKLVHLHISYVSNFFLSEIATQFPDLKTLEITFGSFDTADIQTNAAKLQRLTYLNLYSCTNVNLKLVQSLFTNTEVVSFDSIGID